MANSALAPVTSAFNSNCVVNVDKTAVVHRIVQISCELFGTSSTVSEATEGVCDDTV
jgi:hypothetical protein